MVSLRGLLDNVTAPITPDSLSQPSTLSFIADDVAAALTHAVPVTPAPAPPGAPFSTIYAFGDSLSDVGNVSLATLGLVPVSPPYTGRVFSNGPNWVQELAKNLGLPAIQPSLAGGTDFAYGGAETGQTPTHTLNPTDLSAQVTQFDAQVASPEPNSLYTVWAGSNDVLDIANDASLTSTQQAVDVKAAVENEVAGIQALASRGAHAFVVLNVPDLGKTPYEMARGPTVSQTATTLATLYNTDLTAAITSLQASGAVKIDLVDSFGLLDQAIANPAAAGFSNVTDPAWTGNLTDSHSGTLHSGNYLFFDSLHPTAQAHALLASNVSQNIATMA